MNVNRLGEHDCQNGHSKKKDFTIKTVALLYYLILSSIYSNTQIDKLRTTFVENVERHSVVCSYEFSREINFGKVNVLSILFFLN